MATVELERIALGIEYDGRPFCGWQRQPDGCSVQDALEAALAKVAGAQIAVCCAGRTDAGVHATGQVVHFDTDVSRPLMAWVRGVNSFLPDSTAVMWARPVSSEFHARYSALARSYRYVLLNRPVRPGRHNGQVGWYHAPLDTDNMQCAANQLLGMHDFSAFRAAECQARSPVRQMLGMQVSRIGDQVVFDLTANAFLHHMVRNIVGSLIWIGCGKRSPEWLGDLLQSRNRSLAGPTASAAGLTLRHVDYAPHWKLPESTDRDAGTDHCA